MKSINARLTELHPLKASGYPKIGKKWVSKMAMESAFWNYSKPEHQQMSTALTPFVDMVEINFKKKNGQKIISNRFTFRFRAASYRENGFLDTPYFRPKKKMTQKSKYPYRKKSF